MYRGHLVFLGLCTLLFLSFAKSENEFSDENNQESLGFLEAVSDLSASLDASINHSDEEPLENELVVEPLVAATRAQLLFDNVIPSPSAQTMDGDITEYESTKNALDKGSDEVCRPSTSDTMSCVGDQDMHNKSKLNEASATSRGPSSSENSTSSNSQPNVSDSLKRSSSSLGTKVFMIIAIILLSIFLASVVLYLMFRRSPVPSKNKDSNEVNEMVHTPVSGFQKA